MTLQIFVVSLYFSNFATNFHMEENEKTLSFLLSLTELDMGEGRNVIKPTTNLGCFECN